MSRRRPQRPSESSSPWGEETLNTLTARTAIATAALLNQQAAVFPSHHGGFLSGEFGYAGQPEAFARKLRDVLDHEA